MPFSRAFEFGSQTTDVPYKCAQIRHPIGRGRAYNMSPLELFGLCLLLLYPLLSSYEVFALPSSDDGIGDIPADILKLQIGRAHV